MGGNEARCYGIYHRVHFCIARSIISFPRRILMETKIAQKTWQSFTCPFFESAMTRRHVFDEMWHLPFPLYFNVLELARDANRKDFDLDEEYPEERECVEERGLQF